MINVWALGEYTMAASYASSEDYDRDDDSDYVINGLMAQIQRNRNLFGVL